MTCYWPFDDPHQFEQWILFVYTTSVSTSDRRVQLREFIISDVEGYLAAMENVVIGTLAKYMLESLNCWLMASTSAYLKYRGVLQAFHFLIVNNYLHLI